MPEVTYQGPSASVDIPLEDGTTVVAVRGVPVVVPAEVAASLCDQGSFVATTASAPSTSTTSKPPKAQGAAKKSAPKKSEED